MASETQTEHQTCDMAAWAEKNKTNEHHEHLRKAVGEWTVQGKFFMAPDAPPTETEGETTITAILDGRYTRHDYASTFMDAPFNGLGLDGYDNVKERYVSLWLDSMSTGFCQLEGTREGDVTTFFGESPGPDGSIRKLKSVTTYAGDRMTFSMFTLEGDDYRLSMQLNYTRKK